MIGTLNCDEAAVIDVRGGDVRIDGLDGRASILKHRRDVTVSGVDSFSHHALHAFVM